VKGIPHAPPAPETREAAKKSLAARWMKIPAAERQKLAESPLRLAVLKLKWPKASAAEKETARAGWRQQMGPAIAAAEAKAAAAESAPPAAVAKPAPAAKPANAKQSEYAKTYNKLWSQQIQMQHMQAMSNASRMMHQTSMGIIDNIGGTGARWEYKYVYP
jgi:hypothetical protein